TSGTMGKPKGVVVSHDNITMTARASSQALGHTGEDRVLGAVPVFTIFGMHVVAVTITAGATLVLQERFDAAGALALIRRERVTIEIGRASCRGRVEISVVGVGLQRKWEMWRVSEGA